MSPARAEIGLTPPTEFDTLEAVEHGFHRGSLLVRDVDAHEGAAAPHAFGIDVGLFLADARIGQRADDPARTAADDAARRGAEQAAQRCPAATPVPDASDAVMSRGSRTAAGASFTSDWCETGLISDCAIPARSSSSTACSARSKLS